MLGVRQPRPGLPDGGAAPPDARGDRRAGIRDSCRLFASIPTSVSCSPARPSTGPVALGARGARYLDDGRVEGEDPLAPLLRRTRRSTCVRSDGFEHAPDLFVNSFYDPQLDEGCAFEELISFHGGMGGSQTRPFLLAPVGPAATGRPIVGAASVHAILTGWRALLNHGP